VLSGIAGIGGGSGGSGGGNNGQQQSEAGHVQQPRSIDEHVAAAEHAAKYNPSMPVTGSHSGYLMAKMDYNKVRGNISLAPRNPNARDVEPTM
jgi:hypothetical protein